MVRAFGMLRLFSRDRIADEMLILDTIRPEIASPRHLLIARSMVASDFKGLLAQHFYLSHGDSRTALNGHRAPALDPEDYSVELTLQYVISDQGVKLHCSLACLNYGTLLCILPMRRESNLKNGPYSIFEISTKFQPMSRPSRTCHSG